MSAGRGLAGLGMALFLIACQTRIIRLGRAAMAGLACRNAIVRISVQGDLSPSFGVSLKGRGGMWARFQVCIISCDVGEQGFRYFRCDWLHNTALTRISAILLQCPKQKRAGLASQSGDFVADRWRKISLVTFRAGRHRETCGAS